MGTLSKLDHEALTLAIEMARQDSEGRRQQIDAMLKEGRPWIEVAKFAAGCMQGRALHLRPWEVSPADSRYFDRNDPRSHLGTQASYMLLARMQKAGVSQWHPNPMQALQQVNAAGRQAGQT